MGAKTQPDSFLPSVPMQSGLRGTQRSKAETEQERQTGKLKTGK
jgi:hypothetical protein